MAKITVNERLAQLISEKNRGVKNSSSLNSVSSVLSDVKPATVKSVKVDSVDIKGLNSDESKAAVQTKQTTQTTEATPKVDVYDNNPFIHNQVVDDIAKKLLRAFGG